MTRFASRVLLVASFCGCSSSEAATEPALATPDASIAADAAVDGGVEAAVASEAGPAPLDAKAILARLSACDEITQGRYKNDADDKTATVAVCQLPGLVHFRADMDIDCDGLRTSACSESTDPSFLPATAVTDSTGKPLDAASLPYVVVPLASSRFDYRAHDIKLGAVALVVYQDKLAFGVVGDLGPATIIGEASYAMAERLGIPSSPSTGGVDDGVTYVVFTGAGAVVKPIEDEAKARALGESLARKLLLGP